MIARDLISRCYQGDRKAQHELYGLTVDRVHRLVLRIARHADDAFDIVQDTYVQAFTRINQFDERSSFVTWLCRIAVNEALQFQRKASARVRRETAAGRGEAQDDPFTDGRLDVEWALGELAAGDRSLLLLRYQEGLDYQTISQVMECEAGTVGSRLSRARERVRDLLKNGYAGREENPAQEHPIGGLNNKGIAAAQKTSEAGLQPEAG